MERKAPFLHHSVQLIFNEPGQEAYVNQFKKAYEQNKIPVVISYYESDEESSDKPVVALTNIDRIPVELSLYKLHEFINTHYDTWLVVDNFRLMKAKNSNIDYKIPNDSENIIPYSEIKQDTKMWLLPFIWANYDAKIKKNFPAELQSIAQSVTLEGNTPQNFAINPNIDKSTGNYLHFRITAGNTSLSASSQDIYPIDGGIYLRAESKAAGVIKLSYGEDRANSSFFVLPGTHDYLVRISCQHEWMSAAPDKITVISSAPVVLEKFAILKGD